MPRINIPFIVEGQSIKQHPKIKVAAGGQNYFYATFNICNTWDNINNIKASFQCQDMDNPIIVDLTNGDNCLECEIPWEVIAKIGYFDTGIFGGDRLLTSTARTFVIHGCIYNGDEPQPPSPDWFDKIEKSMEQKISAPESSYVGWFLQVSEVDENEKPLAYKATNIRGLPVSNDCNSVDFGPLYVWGETEDYYFTDHAHDPTVPESQIHMYGNVPVGATGGYSSMHVEYYPVGRAIKIEVDMKIDSLMTPSRQPMWRGFIWEYATPNYPTLYFVISPYSDSNGNNARLMVSQKERGLDYIAQPIKIKYGEFQKWEIIYDLAGKAKFYIDGSHVFTVNGITAKHTKITSKLEIRNCMMNVASGYNSVYFDHIIIKDFVEETDPTVPDWAKQPNKPSYTLEELGAQKKGNYIESPASAIVGQMILIKEVNEKGIPTVWEAANLPGVLVDYDCYSLSNPQVKVVSNGTSLVSWKIVEKLFDNLVRKRVLEAGSVGINSSYADLRIPFTPTGKAIEMSFRVNIYSLITPSRQPMWRGLIFEYSTPGSPILYFAMHRQNNLVYLGVSTNARGDATKTVLIPDLLDTLKFITFTVKYDGVSKASFYVDGSEILAVDGITVPNTKTESSLQIRNCMLDRADSHNEVHFDHIKIVDDPMPGIVREVLSAIPSGDEEAY